VKGKCSKLFIWISREDFSQHWPPPRSTRIFSGRGFFCGQLQNIIFEHFVDEPLEQPNSIVARNKDGKIIGVR
jgi:hypothetical protein